MKKAELVILFLPLMLVLAKKQVKLGILLPMTGSWPIGETIAGAILEALEDGNKLLAKCDRELIYVFNDTHCQEGSGLYEAVDMYYRYQLGAFIGPSCNDVCESVALLSNAWAIPIISWGCTATEFSNKLKFSTFARTIGPFNKMDLCLIEFFAQKGWHNIGILTSSERAWQLTAHGFKEDLKNHGLHVTDFQTFDPASQVMRGRAEIMLREILQDLKLKTRSKSIYSVLFIQARTFCAKT